MKSLDCLLIESQEFSCNIYILVISVFNLSKLINLTLQITIVVVKAVFIPLVLQFCYKNNINKGTSLKIMLLGILGMRHKHTL